MSNPFSNLVDSLKRLHRLGTISDILGWDEQVNLPPGSAHFRAEQMAHFSSLVHREGTSIEFEELILATEDWIENQDQVSSQTRLVVAQARKEFDRENKLPQKLVAHKAEAQSRAYHAWVQARSQSDFSQFAPLLQEQVQLAKEEAACLGFENDAAYDYWIDRFDPGMDAYFISDFFSGLVNELSPLVQSIISSPVKPNPEVLKGFPIDKQESFLHQVVESLGFDFNKGRLDKSVHPFCSGCGLDTRMTTRFFEDVPLDSLFSSVHETGHGLYEQGLPEEHIGTALGTAAGMAAHESQSRLWENQVARSKAFWQFWEPKYREVFSYQLQNVTSEDLYLAINAVSAIPIRVDSDEVTYNLHIALRFEIERGIFSGDIQVDQIPQVWNELSQKYLGITPANDKQGCLQDVHWSGGAFGYFPSYCLGNMLAAQMWYQARLDIPDLDLQFSQGQFLGLLDWLRKNVHALGMQVDAKSMAESVTGKPLGYSDLMKYLKERYGSLYQI